MMIETIFSGDVGGAKGRGRGRVISVMPRKHQKYFSNWMSVILFLEKNKTEQEPNRPGPCCCNIG